jgi:hypothetical protein
MTRTTVPHTAVRFAGTLIAAAALLAGLSGLARPVTAAGDCTVTAADLTVDGDESGLLTSINQYRQSKGKAPLAQSAWRCLIRRPSDAGWSFSLPGA